MTEDIDPVNPAKREQKFRYFKDEECREPVYNIEFPDPVIRGEETAELTLYAKNITHEELDSLQWIPQDPDVKIEWSKDRVMPFEVLTVKFIFTPKEDRKKALSSKFDVQGRAIMRGSA